MPGGAARVTLQAALARLAAGFAPVPVAGRLTRGPAHPVLTDSSASVPLAADPGSPDGSLVAGRLAAVAGGFVLQDTRVLVTATAPPTAAARALAQRVPVLAQRDAIARGVRAWFHAAGFVEIGTPARVVCPGLEPHLVPLASGARWLITSPELHLKKLLAAGVERVFELARTWRGDESGAWHLGEFTMLEWYRAFEGLDALADDVAALLVAAAEAAGVDPSRVPGCDLTLPPERLTVRDAFRRDAGVDLAALRSVDALRAALGTLGIDHAEDDTWDDLYFRLFLARVEPNLGRGRVTILADYPASQAALATVRDDPEWPVARRFEVYANGIELANAFDELTDAAEQRRRHEADRAWRVAHGREAPALDEEFLAALAAGHPPAAGIALGFDRLVALILGLRGVERTVAFPD